MCVGEILADMIMDGESGVIKTYVGGAPFNVAVSASRSGSEVTFLGRLGDDPIGKFLKKQAEKFPLNLNLQIDDLSPTTMAFVSVDETGERDFKFLRHDSADYKIVVEKEFLEEIKPNIVHIGSLMLSEEVGRKTALDIVRECKERNIKVSFDVNYREDVFYKSPDAMRVCLEIIESADIVKFGIEEAEIVYREPFETVLEKLNNPIVCVTCGKDGSIVKFGKEKILAPTVAVKPVDTTGAGDAFFGAFLSGVDKVGFESVDKGSLYEIAVFANAKGAEATLHEGAVVL